VAKLYMPEASVLVNGELDKPGIVKVNGVSFYP
jgi:ribosome-associated protein YbcJ (S4-like RNA binding protein)